MEKERKWVQVIEAKCISLRRSLARRFSTFKSKNEEINVQLISYLRRKTEQLTQQLETHKLSWNESESKSTLVPQYIYKYGYRVKSLTVKVNC